MVSSRNNNETICDTIKNILVIEDDQAIRDSIKMALEFEGYNVFTAANGKEGIEVLQKMPRPCIILLDLMMPIMNGWDFVDTVEKDMVLATIPVVVVSAYSEGREIKASGIIKKPVDLNALLNLVKKFCVKGQG